MPAPGGRAWWCSSSRATQNDQSHRIVQRQIRFSSSPATSWHQLLSLILQHAKLVLGTAGAFVSIPSFARAPGELGCRR